MVKKFDELGCQDQVILNKSLICIMWIWEYIYIYNINYFYLLVLFLLLMLLSWELLFIYFNAKMYIILHLSTPLFLMAQTGPWWPFRAGWAMVRYWASVVVWIRGEQWHAGLQHTGLLPLNTNTWQSLSVSHTSLISSVTFQVVLKEVLSYFIFFISFSPP